jgi:hypothetical protein
VFCEEYWLAVGEEENFQIMIDEEIINNVLEDDNSKNEQESGTPLIICTMAVGSIQPLTEISTRNLPGG